MREEQLEVPGFFWPLAAYAAVTLISTTASVDPAVSLVDSKQLVLFLIVPLVYRLARGHRAHLFASVIIAVGAASALVGLFQYGFLHFDNLGRRPQGALTHYMTYSGALMLVACVAAARLLFGTRDRIWPRWSCRRCSSPSASPSREARGSASCVGMAVAAGAA